MTTEQVGRSTSTITLVFADHAPATLVLLYSRLTNLTNVFTFQYTRSLSNLAPSASDPYLLPLPKHEPDLASRADGHVSHRSSRISAIVLKAAKYESPQGSIPSGPGQIYFENGVVFYQLSLLNNDFALSECLYAEMQNEVEAEVRPPDTVSRLEVAKTPAYIASEFIVPDGYFDQDYEDSPHNSSAEEESDAESQLSLAVFHKDPCTISFEWLENEIQSTLASASSSTGFDESLELLLNELEDRFTSGVSTMETLYVLDHPMKVTRTHFVS